MTSQLKCDQEFANMVDDTSRTREQEGHPNTESTGGPTNRPDIIDNDGDNQVDTVSDDDEDESGHLPSMINQQSSNEDEVPESVTKIVKELDADLDELAKSEEVETYLQPKFQDIDIIHKRIDLIQQNIRENREKTDQQLREMESRIIDGMSSFFFNTNNSNVLENKRPKILRLETN